MKQTMNYNYRTKLFLLLCQVNSDNPIYAEKITLNNDNDIVFSYITRQFNEHFYVVPDVLTPYSIPCCPVYGDRGVEGAMPVSSTTRMPWWSCSGEGRPSRTLTMESPLVDVRKIE